MLQPVVEHFCHVFFLFLFYITVHTLDLTICLFVVSLQWDNDFFFLSCSCLDISICLYFSMWSIWDLLQEGVSRHFPRNAVYSVEFTLIIEYADSNSRWNLWFFFLFGWYPIQFIKEKLWGKYFYKQCDSVIV